MASLVTDQEKVRRFRRLLAAFFVALMLPIGALLFFAFEQMKWEVFHQYRLQAEALVSRINSETSELISRENARAVSDYEFAALPGGTLDKLRSNRNVLSQLPGKLEIPGLVGHFQIDADGNFSSPLLPTEHGKTAAEHPLHELSKRHEISDRLRLILTAEDSRENKDEADEEGEDIPQAETSALLEARPRASQAPLAQSLPQSSTAAPENKRSAASALSQFDAKTSQAYQPNRQRLGSVAELALDDSLEKKSKRNVENTLIQRAIKNEKLAAQKPEAASSMQPGLVAEESEILADEDLFGARKEFDATTAVDTDASMDFAGAADTIREFPSITSFRSEVEPLQLSIFDDEHVILHRNIWQNGQRLVQGLVLHRQSFIEKFVREAFFATPLADMSQLVVAFNDDVLNIFTSPSKYRLVSSANTLTGSLLYQRNLVTPFQNFSLIFNVTELPLGASIKFLVTVTAIMLGVFMVGFWFIYRYGKSQISLARQQQDFVSAVSHELKTPLTSIRMYSEMLKNGWAGEDKKTTYYDYIHTESERLSRLIDNVLQLARISRAQTNNKNEWISVNELLDNTRSAVSSLAKTNGFDIAEKLPDGIEHCKLMGNIDSGMQILINLIDNAIKFSRQADRKQVDLLVNILPDGALEIAVRDYGPGIDESQMKKIFELFYRSENELTRETVGTGIGLSLVRELANGMGASVDVRNGDPGAEFAVKWPAKFVSLESAA